jgi:hypothetical protein
MDISCISGDWIMKWYFTFWTSSRRELGDNEQVFVVENQDSFAKAKEEAVKQLPLGEEGNTYNRPGVEWELREIDVEDEEWATYTNDKYVSPLCGSREL